MPNITNQNDYVLNIQEVSTQLEGLKPKYDEEYLVSDHYNYNYKIIEDRINKLYEKTRLLYDIYEYIKYDLDNKLSEYSDNIDELLNEIERTRDSLKEKTFITYGAKFHRSSNDTYFDRDRISRLKESSIKNNGLSIDRYNVINIPIKSVSLDTNSFEKKRVGISDIINGGTYIAFYYLDPSAGNTVTERISIIFNKPINVNDISFRTLDCNVSEILLINENGQKESVDISSGLQNISLTNATGIEIVLVCDKYENINFTVYNTNTDNIFNLAYDYVLKNKTYNELTKSNHYSSYQTYLKAYDDWYKEAKRIDQINVSNGYPSANIVYNPVKYQENITSEYLNELLRAGTITLKEASSIINSQNSTTKETEKESEKGTVKSTEKTNIFHTDNINNILKKIFGIG